MPFQITDIQVATFPSSEAVNTALTFFGLSLPSIQAALQGFLCNSPVVSGEGYQKLLAHEIERHLGNSLTSTGRLRRASSHYSPRLNEKADLVLEIQGHEEKLFFEVEFRPNVEKDLVKFQIGYNCGRLALGVLVLPLNRTAINPGYKTMPEFRKFVALITELAPSYPLLLLGINGHHLT